MLNRFKNLSIKWKLICGFGLSGLLMVIISWIAFAGLNRLHGQVEFIYKTNVIPITVLSDLRATMQKRSNVVMWHLLANDVPTMEVREKEIAELDHVIQDLLAKYEPAIVTESERRSFEQVKGGIPAYQEARKKVLDSSRSLRKELAAEVQRGELKEKIAVIYAGLDGLVAENQRQAEESYAASQSLSTALNWTQITLNVVAMLIGVWTVWFVSKLIVENLTNVLDAAHHLQIGNLVHRSTVTVQDEIGKLATAFNQMAETLQSAASKQQESIKLQQDQAAEIKGVMNAIGTSQAAVEYKLDGTVLAANENFLKITGYSLDEIKGRHHRMFCDSAYTSTGEYVAFWQKLNRGEFDASAYRRLGKGGKELWLQASYNPVLDANGAVYKVVEFATDITVHKNRNAEYKSKLQAIDKVQAAIEFKLDGTILTANENFLKTVGYSLGEIKGQHHRMFCDPAYTSTGEYAVFWQKLNRGEFDSGQYRRVGKGGKEIWIQASYNPIFDANGKVYKVVKFATDITAQKHAQVELESCMAEAQQSLGALAESDLTQIVQGTYQGELDKIKTSINAALENLTQTVTSVRAAVEAVSNGSEEISKGNEDLSQRTSEQVSTLEETSASMEEMTSTVKHNADNARQANQLAIAARDAADKGGSVTRQAIEAMGEINQSSNKIADIITVIDEIAFQTNLLALNAAVEAARAGEHGRGFAVVAAEVRNLAQRSATAAKQIKRLINESIQRVNDGSELVNQSGRTLEEIVSAVKRVTDIIAEITAASQEQASGIDQVNKAIMSMDETTQQSAALVEETTSAAQSMKEQAKELLQQVSAFNTGQAEAQHRGPVVAKRMVSQMKPKLPAKPAASSSKRAPAQASVPVAVGNGRDHRSSSDDFEEF